MAFKFVQKQFNLIDSLLLFMIKIIDFFDKLSYGTPKIILIGQQFHYIIHFSNRFVLSFFIVTNSHQLLYGR